MDKLETNAKLIRAESELLKQYLSTISVDSWDRQSPCEKWKLADVVAHLVWFADFYNDVISRGLVGDTSLVEGRPPADAPNDNSLFADYLANSAIALRLELGQQLLQRFSESWDRLNDMFGSISGSDWDTLCAFWRRSGNTPIRYFVFVAMQEIAIHSWDVRSSIESHAKLYPESLPVLMERIPSRRSPWNREFKTTSPTPIRYRFDLEGDYPSVQDIVVEEGKARIEPSSDQPAGVTLIGDTDVFVLMMCGRLTLESATTKRLFRISGEKQMIAAFDRWLT